MAKVEVEHRGRLTTEKYNELLKFFEKNGRSSGIKKRFSIIYATSKKTVREDKDNPIDLKLRITNGQPEIALKYGKWSGNDARKEFGFHIDPDQYDDFLEFLNILGYNKAVIMANTKQDYIYHGVEFSLVEVPGWGHYFEAEILIDDDKIDDANKKIDAEIKLLGLKVLSEEDFYDLLDELNNRPGCRVDLDKKSIDKLKKKYKDYF